MSPTHGSNKTLGLSVAISTKGAYIEGNVCATRGLIVDRVQDTVGPARANLMALPCDGKDADHKTGGPRYSLK